MNEINCVEQTLNATVICKKSVANTSQNEILKFAMAFVASAVVIYFTGYFFEKGSIAAH